MRRIGLVIIGIALVVVLAVIAAWHVQQPADDRTGHEMLQFEGMFDQAASQWRRRPAGPSGSRKISYIREEIPEISIPPYDGERYEARVPDTLDMAAQAAMAVHSMTTLTDPRMDYETYFSGQPPHIFSDICGVKWWEAVPLLRIASGSLENLNVDRAWMRSLLKSIGPDGLYYIHRPYLPDENMRAWARSIATADGLRSIADYDLGYFMETVATGRAISVMTIYHLRDRNDVWRRIIERMIARLQELSIDRDRYAYLPVRIFELGAISPSDADMPENMAAEEYTGRFIQGLAQYYRMTGYEPARELNEKYVRYLRNHSQYFNEQGHWTQRQRDGSVVVEGGHFHAHAISLLFMLEHAIATGDEALRDWVERSYLWAIDNTYSSDVMGWFPELVRPDREWSEPCCPADMVALAIKLTEAGAGDYWDDADRWARNHLVETQSRARGWGPGCCTGNAARALYYVWENILEYADGELTVNLLMNRASQWADVNSHIPYWGRVDVTVKKDLVLRMRVPQWVESGSERLAVTVNRNRRVVRWNGRYVDIGRVQPGDEVVMRFPIWVRKVTQRIVERDRTLVVKGNDVISIEPRDGILYLSGYDRSHYLRNETRWTVRERFAPAVEIDW